MFGDIALVTTPECIGVREGRRIIGKYTVGLDDMINGRKQPDGICRVRYWVDIHSLDKGDNNGFTDDGIKAQPYDIPFRSLIPKDADNLLVSGRCISGDFYAHASYRVAGNMATVGEAAGKAAAYAAQKHVDVSKICYSSKDMTFFTDSPEN